MKNLVLNVQVGMIIGLLFSIVYRLDTIIELLK